MKPVFKHPPRTRFAKDIVCEFLPAAKKSSKVLILCAGMPGYPGGAGKAMRTFAEKGYWVFVPRYRGTWESGGEFLKKSPHEDVLAVAAGLSKGFTDFYSGKKMRIVNPKICLIGASFSGGAVILGSLDKRITKAVALSPVVDWTKQDKGTEPLAYMEKFLPLAFGQAYRGDPETIWKKLASGNFYNAEREAKSVNGKKLLIIHAKDDDTVPFAPTSEFAEKVGATFVPLRTGGHLGVSSSLKPRLWIRIEKFLK